MFPTKIEHFNKYCRKKLKSVTEDNRLIRPIIEIHCTVVNSRQYKKKFGRR